MRHVYATLAITAFVFGLLNLLLAGWNLAGLLIVLIGAVFAVAAEIAELVARATKTPPAP